MVDDRTKRGPEDRERVNVNEAYELDYWTKKWGITADKLRAAVKAVGPVAKDVARYLGSSSS